MGLALATAGALFFATGNLLARAGAEHLERGQGLLVSLVTNVLLLVSLSAGVLAWRGPSSTPLQGVLLFAAGGVCGTLLGRWATLVALQHLGPSRAALYKNGQPVVTTVIALTLLGEPFSAVTLFGGAFIVTGILLATGEPLADERSRWDVSPQHRRVGVAFGLLSACGFALANVLRKLGIEIWPEPVLGAAVGAMVALASVLLLPGGVGRRQVAARPWHRGHLLYAAYGCANGTAQLSFFASLMFVPVWIANLFVSTEPLLTILLSWALLRGRERLSRWILVSAFLVVSGVVLMTLQP